MIQRILSIVLLGLIVSGAPATALTFYVDDSSGDNRRSHVVAQADTTPWQTLTHALKVAHLIPEGRPHVIELTEGTYSPSSGETLPFEVTQTGIYVSTEDGVLFDAEGLSRIFTITAPTSDFVLRNVALLNGVADQGGAVYCHTCSLKVTDSRIIGNKATDAGEAIYVEDGRLQFVNNNVRFNGSSSGAPLLTLHNTFADTSQRDHIRNNTFYRNDAPVLLTTGNRTDISSNIFFGTAKDDRAAIIDSVTDASPLIRYNLFWEVDILTLSEERDTTKVVRTVRDTATVSDFGISLPSFVTNRPDTIAQVGATYEYEIETENDKSEYSFNRVTTSDLPAAIATADWQAGILRWTPDSTDVGDHALRVEIIHTPSGQLQFLSYVLEVFSADDFPDTTRVWPIINISFVPDTTRALDTLNTIVPAFSSAASAGNNLYDDPLFLNVEVNSFSLTASSPARDAGSPVIDYEDAVVSGGGLRNDIGFTGGPGNGGAPAAGSATEVGALSLPDSLVLQGSEWTYTPSQDQTKSIILIDPISGHDNPPTLAASLGSLKPIPVVWEPTIADTGSWLVGLTIFNSDGSSARHYFPLRVRPVNEPPQITSTAPSQAFEDSAFVYAVEVLELDGDAVTFALTSAPDSMTIDAAGNIAWTPTQQDTGSVTVDVLVTDVGGESSSQTFTLAVLNTNDRPTFDAVADTSATEDSIFSLQLSASDIDIADTSFVFTLLSGPDSATVDSSGLVSWMPVQADVGVATLKVQAQDAQGGIDSTSFTITVLQVDDAPIITSTADTTAPEDAAYEYTVTASDEEGEAITFELTSSPAAMSIDTTGAITWTPVQADTGNHDVAIRVADPAGNEATQAFTLVVTAVNDAPTLVSRTPADSFFFFEPGQGIVFRVTATDEENDELSFRWLVDGVVQVDTDDDLLHVPDTTTADTVVSLILDGTDSTIVQWIVDARAIPLALLQPDSIDFGTVTLGDSASAVLSLSNPGRSTLVISNLQVGNLELTSVFSSSQVLEDETETLQVRYIAANRGSLSTTIAFDTNDPDRSTVSIPVSGFGLIPTRVSLDLDPTAGNQQGEIGGGEAGDTVGVDIYAADALDIIEGVVEITFDPALLTVAGFEPHAAGDSNLVTDPTIVVTEPSSGRVRVEVSTDTTAGSSEDGSSGDGLLGRLLLVIGSDAVADTEGEVRLELVELLSEGFTEADTLLPEIVSVIRVRSRLPTDLNDDGIVNFDDFFLFVAVFGTTDSRGDFDNSGGIVDFDDFFVFAASFGERARPARAAPELAMEGLNLFVSDRPSHLDLLEAQITWSGETDLLAAALTVEFDPRVLTFMDIQDTPGAATSLLWKQDVRPGIVQLAFGRGSTGAYTADYPLLRFARHTPDATTLRLAHGLGHSSAGQTIALPVAGLTNVAALPVEFVLYPAYPNPFNPETTLSLFVPALEAEQPIRLRIFDLLGQPVRTLIDESRSAGHHAITWHGRDDEGRSVGAGVYLIELVTPTSRFVHKTLYLK
ncbi:MAG: DUF1565 domain-containing protein [Gemmatimonadetes bacterium]|nr:DUF1565 domain-containing protein [Gemmatimonadota bacterium]